MENGGGGAGVEQWQEVTRGRHLHPLEGNELALCAGVVERAGVGVLVESASARGGDVEGEE